MRTDDFNFDLPEELIAQYPPERRGMSRLFVLDRGSAGREDEAAGGSYTHAGISEIARFVEPGTVMVFNDSKVRKGRLYAEALDTGAKVEFLILQPEKGTMDSLGRSARWRAICSKIRRQKPGRTYEFPSGIRGTIVGESDEERIVEFDTALGDTYFDTWGHIPLPPYIHRTDSESDSERYQTVYAHATGSAAAPTAGLHFTNEILENLVASGIELAWVTLHVGLGTFLPVRSERIEDHRMHSESYSVPEATAEAVNRAKREGRKVLAVGTTSLRTLESAWVGDHLGSGWGETSIFIYPGYQFKAVDMLFTNFHTPKSTLLMLVSAFAGREAILGAYREAIVRGYRFFSYGDAMLIR